MEVRQVDLSDRGRCVDSSRQIRHEFPFTGLVNQAGIIEFETFDQFSLEGWYRTLEVNLTAALILARELGNGMPAGSSIVNIASTDAHVSSYSSIAYSASKAALLSITRSLANVLVLR